MRQHSLTVSLSPSYASVTPVGQPGAGRGMREVVTHVSEIGPPRADAPRRLDRLVERKVCRVRPLAQRVEHEDVETLEQRPRRIGDARCSP